jgi:hypothetical protein
VKKDIEDLPVLPIEVEGLIQSSFGCREDPNAWRKIRRIAHLAIAMTYEDLLGVSDAQEAAYKEEGRLHREAMKKVMRI